MCQVDALFDLDSLSFSSSLSRLAFFILNGWLCYHCKYHKA